MTFSNDEQERTSPEQRGFSRDSGGRKMLRAGVRLAIPLILLPALFLLPALESALAGPAAAPDPAGPVSQVNVGDLASFLWFESRILTIVGIALSTAALTHGPRVAISGLKRALMAPRVMPNAPARPHLVAEAEALSLAARMVVFIGLLAALTDSMSDLAMIRAVLDGTPFNAFTPGTMGRGLSGSLAVPLTALWVGHLWFGGAADAAFRQSGRSERAPFRSGSDFLPLLFLVPLVLPLLLGFYKFPVK